MPGADTRRQTGVDGYGGDYLLAQRWPSLSAKPETAAARCAAAFRLAMPMWRYTPDRRSREDASSDQARLKTSVPFVPPKPNEFFSATSIFISRAVFAQ